MSEDKILTSFLRAQSVAAADFNRRSDLAQLVALPGDPVQRYVLHLRCRGLVRAESGAIEEAGHFAFGICFRDDHLRRIEPAALITNLRPAVWHPNVAWGTPWVCLGHVAPGVKLVDLCYSLFEVVSYHKYNPENPLNEDAAAWARRHQHLFPLERRPLLRSGGAT